MYIAVQPPRRLGVSSQPFLLIAVTEPEKNTTSSGDPETNSNGYIWAYATLVDASTSSEAPPPSLAGQRAGNAFPIDEGSGTAGTRQGRCAIVWPKLSVTKPGTYRVRIDLYWVPHEEGLDGQDHIDTVFSRPVGVVAGGAQQHAYSTEETEFIGSLQGHGFDLGV